MARRPPPLISPAWRRYQRFRWTARAEGFLLGLIIGAVAWHR